MKALRLIAGVILLLASMYLGSQLAALEAADFLHIEVLMMLSIYLAALIAAAFLIPKFCRVYLVLISAALAFWQFGSFDWIPLTLSCATLLPLAFIHPKLFQRGLLIPLLSLTVLSIDAFAFQHRYAIFVYSTVHSFDLDTDPPIIKSPSGKTTVYVISGGLLDSFYTICISSGRLMPICHVIAPGREETRHSELITRWEGPVFLGGDTLVSFAYDERTNRIIERFMKDGTSIGDENTKSPESFAEYLLSLPPKAED